MGITIDEAIRRIDEHNYIYIYRRKEPRAVYITEAFDVAISTMRKYQHIEEIMNNRANKTSLEIVKAIMGEMNIVSDNSIYHEESLPTYRQESFAKDIATILRIPLPKEKSKLAYSNFISENVDRFKEVKSNQYYPSESDEWDLEDCVSHGY